MSRSKSSGRWLQEHFDDPYVKKAQELGLRSRAAFKLLEINEKDSLLKPGMTVLDLGAAPGGWSQVAAAKVGDSGKVIASDILEIDALAGVTFIQGDFTENPVYEAILAAVGDSAIDLVISDMAPNFSGSNAVDQPRAMYLVELAFDMAGQVLGPDGNFLVKVFQGEGFDQYRQAMRTRFKRLVTRKPAASRARSREVYLLGIGFKG